MDGLDFLPEEDRDFMRERDIAYEVFTEQEGGELKHAIAFLNVPTPAHVYRQENGSWVQAGAVTVLVQIPKGYAQNRLDSWYTRPTLALANGAGINCATGVQTLYGHDWQFWSRHLTAEEWRPGIDGLETYLQYIRQGLKDA